MTSECVCVQMHLYVCVQKFAGCGVERGTLSHSLCKCVYEMSQIAIAAESKNNEGLCACICISPLHLMMGLFYCK